LRIKVNLTLICLSIMGNTQNIEVANSYIILDPT
jgi:hypothetical protein